MKLFSDLPRYFGTPSQIYLTNPIALQNFLNVYNGKRPCFISTYRFPEPDKPIVDCAVFDFDSKVSLNLAYKDTKKLKNFCDSKDIPYIINFSGGKGFHFFLFFAPEEGNSDTRDKLYSLQLSLVKNLSLNTIDLPTIGRLRFLIRYPTTKYVRRETRKKKVVYESNGYYCRNITPSEFDKGLNYILKLAKEPGDLPDKPKPHHTIDDIVQLIPNFKLQHKYGGLDQFEFLSQEGIMVPTLEAVGLPCLKVAAQKPNPSHQERVELVAWLKLLGYRDLAIIAFIKNLNWADYNYKITAANVASIKPRFPACSWLREHLPGYCDKCSFKRMWGGGENS